MPWPKPRFSLRALFVLMTAAAVLCSLFCKNADQLSVSSEMNLVATQQVLKDLIHPSAIHIWD